MAGVWALLDQSLLFASHDCHPHSCTTPGVLSRAQIASSHTVEQEALARPECTLQPWQRPSARHSQSDYRKREPPQQPYLGSVRFLSEFHPWKYLLGVKPPGGRDGGSPATSVSLPFSAPAPISGTMMSHSLLPSSGQPWDSSHLQPPECPVRASPVQVPASAPSFTRDCKILTPC